MAPDGELQRLGGHVRVPVAVAADPVSHPEEGRGRLTEMLVDLRIKLRQFREEGRFVIAERILDLVANGQRGVAQQAGLPELRDPRAEHQRVLGAVARAAERVAFGEQPRDGALRIQCALALHLRRMRGQHRRDIGLRKRRRDALRLHAGRGQPLEGARQRPLLMRAAGLPQRATADMVPVLGDVREMREVAEGPHHRDRLGMGETLQQPVQFLRGVRIGLAADGDGETPYRLDHREDGFALLFADGVAQDLAKQPNVVEQRLVLVGSKVVQRMSPQHSGRPTQEQRQRPKRPAGGAARCRSLFADGTRQTAAFSAGAAGVGFSLPRVASQRITT